MSKQTLFVYLRIVLPYYLFTMKRKIIHIDEEKCTGCGICVPECQEGALQIIDDKARLISDLFCDGLGACIGHCPEDAISIEEREAEPYDELKVLKKMVPKGKNTVHAHLKHLKDHQAKDFLQQGLDYLKSIDFNMDLSEFDDSKKRHSMPDHHHEGFSCPGSMARDFSQEKKGQNPGNINAPSELQQWPVQLHLLNASAPFLKNADLLLAADCVAFSMGNFHNYYLKGKKLAIACPKLDNGKEVYVNKLKHMIDEAGINSITVVMMEVPCCGGLLSMVEHALEQAKQKVPIKKAVIGLQGDILSEEWI